jgi:hypothetical protein
MNNTKNVKSIRPSNALTEAQLTELERNAVRKLKQALSVWHQHLGPGMDGVFAGLGQLITAADRAAAKAQTSSGSMLKSREAAANEMLNHLAVPKFEGAHRQRAARVRILGGHKKTALEMAYEARTLTLLTDDFDAWYDEVGLGGFLASLIELCNVYGEIFHEYMEDESLATEKVSFFQLSSCAGGSARFRRKCWRPSSL